MESKFLEVTGLEIDFSNGGGLNEFPYELVCTFSFNLDDVFMVAPIPPALIAKWINNGSTIDFSRWSLVRLSSLPTNDFLFVNVIYYDLLNRIEARDRYKNGGNVSIEVEQGQFS